MKRAGLGAARVAAALAVVVGGCASVEHDRPAPSRAEAVPRTALAARSVPTPKTAWVSEATEGATAVVMPRVVPQVVQLAAAPEGDPAGAAAEVVEPTALPSSTASTPPARTTRPASAVVKAREAAAQVVSIDFARGQAAPGPEVADVLSVLAARGQRAALIAVAGYARLGGRANLALAQQRATAVKDELVARGVQDSKIRVSSKLEEEVSGRASRVDVVLFATSDR
jgi:outer membrane protein OmpA-like peptidoglycan-associated protein